MPPTSKFDLGRTIDSVGKLSIPVPGPTPRYEQQLPNEDEVSYDGRQIPKLYSDRRRGNLSGLPHHQICSDCRALGRRTACTFEYSYGAGVCTRSGIVDHTTSEGQAGAVMPFKPSAWCDAVSFDGTAMETVVSRKSLRFAACALCGAEKDDSTVKCAQVSMAAVAARLLHGDGKLRCQPNMRKEVADSCLQRLKDAPDHLPLPLRICETCDKSGKGQHTVKSSCFAAHGRHMASPKLYDYDARIAKVDAKYDAMVDATGQAWDGEERQAERDKVKTPQQVYGSFNDRQKIVNDLNNFMNDTWEQLEDPTSDKSYHMLKHADLDKNTLDGRLDLYDRHFHSCLLNEAVALHKLTVSGKLELQLALRIVKRLFDYSEWRYHREVGIKGQLLQRVFHIPGNPFKFAMDSSASAEFQNRMGTLVEAFVQAHVDVLVLIVEGKVADAKIKEYNHRFNQASGFQIGNASADAIVIARFFEFMTNNFETIEHYGKIVPLVAFDGSQENLNYQNMNTWMKAIDMGQNPDANTLHEYYVKRREVDDDFMIGSKPPGGQFARLRAHEGVRVDKEQKFKGEKFRPYYPDQIKGVDSKPHRPSIVQGIYFKRGDMMYTAAKMAGFFDDFLADTAKLKRIARACHWLVLRPSANADPPVMTRMADIGTCIRVSVKSKHTVAPSDLKVADGQMRANERPRTTRREGTSLPKSHALAAKQYEVRNAMNNELDRKARLPVIRRRAFAILKMLVNKQQEKHPLKLAELSKSIKAHKKAKRMRVLTAFQKRCWTIWDTKPNVGVLKKSLAARHKPFDLYLRLHDPGGFRELERFIANAERKERKERVEAEKRAEAARQLSAASALLPGKGGGFGPASPRYPKPVEAPPRVASPAPALSRKALTEEAQKKKAKNEQRRMREQMVAAMDEDVEEVTAVAVTEMPQLSKPIATMETASVIKTVDPVWQQLVQEEEAEAGCAPAPKPTRKRDLMHALRAEMKMTGAAATDDSPLFVPDPKHQCFGDFTSQVPEHLAHVLGSAGACSAPDPCEIASDDEEERQAEELYMMQHREYAVADGL